MKFGISDSKRVYFPKVSLRDGYLHNTPHDKILLFLSNLKKLLTWRRKTLKGWGQQVPNTIKSLYFCVLRSETCLRADEICVADRHISAVGVPSMDPDQGDKAGTRDIGNRRGKSIVACHVSLSSWLWKTLFKQTVVYISMSVPVCPDS